MKTPPLSRLAGNVDPKLRVMALDPGQTTGYAYFVGLERVEYGQQTLSAIEAFLDEYEVGQIVVENYRIYQSKARVQGNLYTPRLLGRIEAYAEMHAIPVAKQMAVVAKRFCTDGKLVDWDLYVPGRGHAMDATRHGCYWLIFGGQ